MTYNVLSGTLSLYTTNILTWHNICANTDNSYHVLSCVLFNWLIKHMTMMMVMVMMITMV